MLVAAASNIISTILKLKTLDISSQLMVVLVNITIGKQLLVAEFIGMMHICYIQPGVE